MILDWAELKRLILERFRPSQEGSLYEKFLALQKESIVREYRLNFEVLAAPLIGVPEQVLEGNFIKGLSKIWAEIRMLKLVGLGPDYGVGLKSRRQELTTQAC